MQTAVLFILQFLFTVYIHLLSGIQQNVLHKPANWLERYLIIPPPLELNPLGHLGAIDS